MSTDAPVFIWKPDKRFSREDWSEMKGFLTEYLHEWNRSGKYRLSCISGDVDFTASNADEFLREVLDKPDDEFALFEEDVHLTICAGSGNNREDRIVYRI